MRTKKYPETTSPQVVEMMQSVSLYEAQKPEVHTQSIVYVFCHQKLFLTSLPPRSWNNTPKERVKTLISSAVMTFVFPE